MQDWAAHEGKTGTLPDGRRIVVRGGQPVVLKEGSIPAGYRQSAQGGVEPIPGSQEATKAARQQLSNDGRVRTAQNMLGTIREAQGLVGPFSAGFLGPAVKKIGGTNAADLETKVNTLKANLAFDRLQEMRDNSPTGGAVGNVTERELELLAATVASLDQKQSPEELRKSLTKVEEHYRDIRNRLGFVEAYKTPPGASRGPPNPRARPGGNRPVRSGDSGVGRMSDDEIRKALGL